RIPRRYRLCRNSPKCAGNGPCCPGPRWAGSLGRPRRLRGPIATLTADKGHLRWHSAARTPMCAVMKIAIASDHAAFALKADLIGWLRELGHEVADLGPDGIASVDYPDYGYKLAGHIAAGDAEYG